VALDPPRSADTRAQILRIARRLIKTRSYLGFSFQDIADEVGIRKPSLYHHFPSKEALGVAVLRQSIEAFAKWAAKTPAEPEEKLAAYFELYRYELGAARAVCPAGALAPGWDCIEETLRSTVRELRAVQIEWLASFAADLMPDIRSGSAHGWAAVVFATCQGGLICARMTGFAEDFDAAIAGLCPAALKLPLESRSLV
jgi:TetR/AcrR family transcriptional regulator, transcriptional repressor for nem operon